MADLTTHPLHAATTGLRRARWVFRPDHDPAIRQEALGLVRTALQKAGFELGRLDDLRRQDDAKMREALAKSRAAAAGRGPAMRDAVARSAESWLKANRLGEGLSPDLSIYSVDTADRISVTPGIEFLSEKIAPFANSAEVILDRTTEDVDGFEGVVTFSFSWENQTGQDGPFTVTAVLGVTATCDVTADQYWWPLNPTPPASHFDAFGDLRITEIVDGQVTEPPYQSTQTQEIVDLNVHGLLFGGGNIEGQDVFRAYALQYSGLSVPLNGRVEFDVSCYLNWYAYGGGVQFVATGSGRQIAGYGVFITTGSG